MQHTLYLTAEEKKLFDGLPDTLREGWVVEGEQIHFVDSDKHRITRAKLTKFRDPRFTKIHTEILNADSPEKTLSMLETMDISMQDEDFVSLLFALGPDVISTFIHFLLTEVKSDKDVATISALSFIRHSLDSALSFE